MVQEITPSVLGIVQEGNPLVLGIVQEVIHSVLAVPPGRVEYHDDFYIEYMTVNVYNYDYDQGI